MKKLLISMVLCVAGVVFAAPPPPPPPAAGGAAPAKDAKAGGDMKAGDMKAGDMAKPAGGDMMSMWKPHKADAKKDEKGLEAAMKGMHDAMMKGDVEAAAAYVDFPVMMVTDDSKGNAMSMMATKEQWTGMMKGFGESMKAHPDMKMNMGKPKMDWLTNSLVVVHMDGSMSMGKEKKDWSNAGLWIMRDGKWMSKVDAEGGWGDMPMGGEKGAMAPMPAGEQKSAAMK